MTENLKADKLLVAHGLVGFEYGGGTVGPAAVAVRLVAATVVFPTLVPYVEPTVTIAARSLKS